MLPWSDSSKIGSYLPWVPENRLVGINLDSYLLADSPSVETSRKSAWSVEYPNTTWANKLSKLTTYPMSKAKTAVRSSDEEVFSNIPSSSGLVLPAQDRGQGTWWSYRLVQALNSTTPIITEWKESWILSDSWSVLIGELEDMNIDARIALAISQRESYMDSIPSQMEVLDSFKTLIKSVKE